MWSSAIRGTESFPQTFNRPPVTDPSFANGQPVFYDPPDGSRPPQVVSWMAGVQRELASGLIVDASLM